MTKDRTIPMIIMVVALVGLVIHFNGGATGASGSKGTIIDYPTPTYYGGQHRDFPEVSEWAYYQYGISTNRLLSSIAKVSASMTLSFSSLS